MEKYLITQANEDSIVLNGGQFRESDWRNLSKILKVGFNYNEEKFNDCFAYIAFCVQDSMIF
jgi:hypothetical protein